MLQSSAKPSEYIAPDDLIDPELWLPLSMIAVHVKADDIPHTTDALLELYRQAAIEACEHYTGRRWTFSGVVVQSIAAAQRKTIRPMGIAQPGSFMGSSFTSIAQNRAVTIVLDEPPIDGILTIISGSSREPNRTIAVPPGIQKIQIPIYTHQTAVSFGGRGHDDMAHYNFGMTVRYRGGVADPSRIPAGIKLGCLKHIAWSVENPGDVLRSVNDVRSASARGEDGTNNGAWASGAIELWRQYRRNVAR
jgi:hypothetical protein